MSWATPPLHFVGRRSRRRKFVQATRSVIHERLRPGSNRRGVKKPRVENHDEHQQLSTSSLACWVSASGRCVSTPSSCAPARWAMAHKTEQCLSGHAPRRRLAIGCAAVRFSDAIRCPHVVRSTTPPQLAPELASQRSWTSTAPRERDVQIRLLQATNRESFPVLVLRPRMGRAVRRTPSTWRRG